MNVPTNSDARDGFELSRNADCTGEDANTFASSGDMIVVVPDSGALFSSGNERKFDLFDFEFGVCVEGERGNQGARVPFNWDLTRLPPLSVLRVGVTLLF